MPDIADPKASFAAKLAELKTQFAVQLVGTLDALESKVSGRGPDLPPDLMHELHVSLHKLAGSGGSFGFPELSTQARELELVVKGWIDSAQPGSAQQWRTWQAGLQDLRQTIGMRSTKESEPANAATEQPQASVKGAVRVVLIHPDKHLGEDLRRGLGPFGYAVTQYESIGAAKNVLPRQATDVMLVQIADEIDQATLDSQAVIELREQLNGHVPAIFLANSSDLSIQLCAARALGDAFLTTPVDIPGVAARIEELIREGEQLPLRVLIVDDDESLAEHYRLVLQADGMLAERACNPSDALAMLHQLRPDVLLMDLYMPQWTGAELARVIRYDENWQGMPIIYLSAEADLNQQIRAMGSGADSFLVKPIGDMQLVSAVRSRAKRARKLAEMMRQDSLTGLLKHASIKDRLEQEAHRASRNNKSLSVAMIDIDFFKRVNDGWGHPMGDQVIKTLGQLLRQRLRRQDGAGRYGGEEFLVILPECHLNDARQLIDDIRRRFSDISFVSNGQSFNVTISAGVVSTHEFRQGQDLLAAADKALYKAKQSGRNQICSVTLEETRT